MRLHGATSAELRECYLAWVFVPVAMEMMGRQPRIERVQLMVAQYWDDNARDAVHTVFLPLIPGGPAFESDAWYQQRLHDLSWTCEKAMWPRPTYFDNLDLVRAFATFCPPHKNQNMDMEEAFVPFAELDRAGVYTPLGEVHQGQWEDAFWRASYSELPDLGHPGARERALGRELDGDELLELLEADVLLGEKLHRIHQHLAGRSKAATEWAEGWLRRESPARPHVGREPLPASNRLLGGTPEAMRAMASDLWWRPLAQHVGPLTVWGERGEDGVRVWVEGKGVDAAQERLTGHRGPPVGPTVDAAFRAFVPAGSPVRIATVDGEAIDLVARRLGSDPSPGPLSEVDAALLQGARCLDLMDALARTIEHLDGARRDSPEAARADERLGALVQRAHLLLG